MRTYTAIALIALLAVSNAQTVAVAAYDDYNKCKGATFSTGVTKNKLQGIATSGVIVTDKDACTGSGSLFVKLTVTTTNSVDTYAIKTHSVNTCLDANAAPSTAEQSLVADATTIALNTCHAVRAANSAVVAAGTPYFRLEKVNTNKYRIWAYDDQATCEGTTPTGVAVSTASTTNKLHDLASTTFSSTTAECKKIGTTTNYAKLTHGDATKATSFKTYSNDACSATEADVAATGTTLTYGACLPLKYDNTVVAAADTLPFTKLTYTAPKSTTSAMNMSVGIAALFALLIAALF